jgi:uncharacterized protein YbjT (DUF2867 family)
MNDAKKTALVVGATGLIGGHCVRLLLDHDAYEQVKILVRRPVEISHPKLSVIIADFDDMECHAGDLAADDVFCALGTTIGKAGSEEAFRKVDFDYTIKIASLLEHANARQFLLVSAMGANPRSKVFYNRVKGDVEEALRRIPFETIQVFRPSMLLGKRKEWRTGERIGGAVMSVLNPAFFGSMKKWRAIEASSVARAMIIAAQTASPGFHIYMSDMIQEMSVS